MKKSYLLPLYIISLLILLAACAAELPPGGGPPDKIPPHMTASSLAHGSIKVPYDYPLHFYFSERLNPKTIEKNITLFPLSEGPVSYNYDAGNRKISIYPKPKWNNNTIYTLAFNKGIADLRNNTMQQPYQFSFTPGNFIPQTAIKGKIVELPENRTAWIFLSRIHQSIDSIIVDPEYFTQSNPQGEFSFDHMPEDTFYIAAYIDEDKSNSYKELFDLPVIPRQPFVIADTLDDFFLLQAAEDNFLSGKLIRTESISPCETKLSFTKILSAEISAQNFIVNDQEPDTLLAMENELTLYHKEIKLDSTEITFKDLKDRLGLAIDDSTLNFKVNPWEDDLFNFKVFKKHLLVHPHPGTDQLEGDFYSSDTSLIKLIQEQPGFYKLPIDKKPKNGNFKFDPSKNGLLDTALDTVYSIDINLLQPEEFGRILALTDTPPSVDYRFILHNSEIKYEVVAQGNELIFDNVLPGTYKLSYYYDRNRDNKRNPGSLQPFNSPEFIIPLDEGIDVKARWDTELTDPYKIQIEKK